MTATAWLRGVAAFLLRGEPVGHVSQALAWRVFAYDGQELVQTAFTDTFSASSDQLVDYVASSGQPAVGDDLIRTHHLDGASGTHRHQFTWSRVGDPWRAGIVDQYIEVGGKVEGVGAKLSVRPGGEGMPVSDYAFDYPLAPAVHVVVGGRRPR